MKKNQKILIGVGAVAVVGYLLWKKQQTSFTGAVGRRQKNATGSRLYGAEYSDCAKKKRAPWCNVPCGYNSDTKSCRCVNTGRYGEYPNGGLIAWDCDTQQIVPNPSGMRQKNASGTSKYAVTNCTAIKKLPQCDTPCEKTGVGFTSICTCTENLAGIDSFGNPKKRVWDCMTGAWISGGI